MLLFSEHSANIQGTFSEHSTPYIDCKGLLRYSTLFIGDSSARRIEARRTNWRAQPGLQTTAGPSTFKRPRRRTDPQMPQRSSLLRRPWHPASLEMVYLGFLRVEDF